MIKHIALAAVLLAAPTAAQEEPKGAPSPTEIVAQAAPAEWVRIAPEDLLVMTLAPDAAGKQRQVVIQLMPAPFSQPWVANIRTLAKANWWDGLAIVRVQDNYVVQWGDPDGDDAAKARKLPDGMQATNEKDYTAPVSKRELTDWADEANMGRAKLRPSIAYLKDPYADLTTFEAGWPIGTNEKAKWPVHCYDAVGVGRNYSPDAGTGAELYTVIGHAPRQLDRNIALVGRVIEGIENLSSLPRGTGPLGFYESGAERTQIASVRLASELPAAEQPQFEFLSTDGDTFARYAEARANRRDPFFIVPAGGADVCNIPVPIRRVPGSRR